MDWGDRGAAARVAKGIQGDDRTVGAEGFDERIPLHRVRAGAVQEDDRDSFGRSVACGRPASQVLKTCFERPSTMSSSLAGPVPARTAVRSMITVTYLSPRRV